MVTSSTWAASRCGSTSPWWTERVAVHRPHSKPRWGGKSPPRATRRRTSRPGRCLTRDSMVPCITCATRSDRVTEVCMNRSCRIIALVGIAGCLGLASAAGCAADAGDPGRYSEDLDARADPKAQSEEDTLDAAAAAGHWTVNQETRCLVFATIRRQARIFASPFSLQPTRTLVHLDLLTKRA